GSASMTGNGVMIYNAGSTYPTAGGTYGGMTLNTTGKVNLSPATTGAYAGVLFFQARTNPTLVSISGGSSVSLSGLIYASDALLSVGGSIQLSGALDVNRLQFTGTAGETILNTNTPTPAIQTGLGSLSSPLKPVVTASTTSPSSSPAVSSVTELNQAGQSTSLSSTDLVGADDGETVADGQSSSGSMDHFATLFGQTEDSVSPMIEIAQTATSSQSADESEGIPGISTVVEGVDLDDEDGFSPARFRTSIVTDSVLNDLVSAFVPTSRQEADRAIDLPSLVLGGILDEGASPTVKAAGNPGHAAIPKGPMPAQGWLPQSVEPRAKPEDLVLVAGLCGLRAGMMAVEDQRNRKLSSWRRFLGFRP
ncbi:MAG: hypothetical protein ACLQGP_11630, partial [Isosphaeraceae bacterium]